MNESSKLTVYFEDPFWAGVFERIEDGRLSVCKVTFGAEPRDYEVWAFVLENCSRLKFSPTVNVTVKKKAGNPKRLQREENKLIRKQSVVSSVRRKSSACLNASSRNERKSIRGGNAPEKHNVPLMERRYPSDRCMIFIQQPTERQVVDGIGRRKQYEKSLEVGWNRICRIAGRGRCRRMGDVQHLRESGKQH